MIRVLIGALAAALPAQSVTVTNPTPFAWSGWVRCDQEVAIYMGWSSAAMFVGADGQVDLKVEIAANTSRTLDLGTFPEWVRPLPQWADIAALYQGLPTLNGEPMSLRAAYVDGAGWRMKWAGIYEGVWHTGISLIWYPDQPWLIQAEYQVLCRDLVSPQIWHSLPSNLNLMWGDASVNGSLLASGTVAQSGELFRGRRVFAWNRLAAAGDLTSIACAYAGGISQQ